MSSSSPNESSTPTEGLQDDELSKRFYYGGMFGLPWLWIVHAVHFYGKQRNIEAQRMLREEQQLGGKGGIICESWRFARARLATILFALTFDSCSTLPLWAKICFKDLWSTAFWDAIIHLRSINNSLFLSGHTLINHIFSQYSAFNVFLHVNTYLPTDQSPIELDTNSETAEKERVWVTRGRNSAVIVSAIWVTWVLFAQQIFPDSLPSSWYVRDATSYAATGW